MPADYLAAPEDRIHILLRSRDRLQVVGVNQKTDNGLCHECRKGHDLQPGTRFRLYGVDLGLFFLRFLSLSSE